MAALLHLLREVVPAKQLTILFTATRHHAEFLQVGGGAAGFGWGWGAGRSCGPGWWLGLLRLY